MLRKGFTQESLGRECNPPVSQNAIYKILTGSTKKPRCLPDLAKALGVSTESLMNDSVDNMNVPQSSRKKSAVQRYIDSLDPDSQRITDMYNYTKSLKALDR